MSVARLLKKHDLAPEDLIVLVDEVDLPFGSLRVRGRGSAGSHNGMKSIIGALESDSFARVRMGIGPERPVTDRVSYVLGRFRKADLEAVAEMLERAADAVEMIVRQGVEKAMNRYNRRASSPSEGS